MERAWCQFGGPYSLPLKKLCITGRDANRANWLSKQDVAEAISELRELIVLFNTQCANGEFPAGELNDRRVNAVREAIQAIEAATEQPTLRQPSN